MKSSVLMYKYNSDTDNDSAPVKSSSSSNKSASICNAATDLTRFNHYGKYKLNYEWNFQENAHNIQCLSCINSIQSPLILSSSSDK
jgi:hypothetical protein